MLALVRAGRKDAFSFKAAAIPTVMKFVGIAQGLQGVDKSKDAILKRIDILKAKNPKITLTEVLSDEQINLHIVTLLSSALGTLSVKRFHFPITVAILAPVFDKWWIDYNDPDLAKNPLERKKILINDFAQAFTVLFIMLAAKDEITLGKSPQGKTGQVTAGEKPPTPPSEPQHTSPETKMEVGSGSMPLGELQEPHPADPKTGKIEPDPKWISEEGITFDPSARDKLFGERDSLIGLQETTIGTKPEQPTKNQQFGERGSWVGKPEISEPKATQPKIPRVDPQIDTEVERAFSEGRVSSGVGVRIPASKNGKPVEVLDVGAGRNPVNLGVPPEGFLVAVTRSDIPETGSKPDIILDATKPLPKDIHGRFTTLFINNPYGYDPNIASLKEGLCSDGKIIVQGNWEANKYFRKLASVDVPDGMKRIIERNAVPLGEGFQFTDTSRSGAPVPNSRITFELMNKQKPDTGVITKPSFDPEPPSLKKTMVGAGGSSPVNKKSPAHIMDAIAEKHQITMADETQHRLAPREAPAIPADLAAKQRKPIYTAPKGRSDTIGGSHGSLESAQKVYDQVIAETGGKYEVGIWQHTQTGEYIVRLGQATEVNSPYHGNWRAVQHYHTNAPDIPLWRMPARADVSGLSHSVAGEGRTMTEIVESRLPNGKIGRTAYTVSADGKVKVEFIDAADQRVQKNFNSIDEYNSDYESRKILVSSEVVKDTDQWLAARRGNTEPVDTDSSRKTNFGVASNTQPNDKPVTAAEPITSTHQEHAATIEPLGTQLENPTTKLKAEIPEVAPSVKPKTDDILSTPVKLTHTQEAMYKRFRKKLEQARLSEEEALSMLGLHDHDELRKLVASTRTDKELSAAVYTLAERMGVTARAEIKTSGRSPITTLPDERLRVRDQRNIPLRQLRDVSPSEALGNALKEDGFPMPAHGHHAHHVTPFRQLAEEMDWLHTRMEIEDIPQNTGMVGEWLPGTSHTPNVSGATPHLSNIHAGKGVVRDYAYTLTSRLYDKTGPEFVNEYAKIIDEIGSSDFRHLPAPKGWEPGMPPPKHQLR